MRTFHVLTAALAGAVMLILPDGLAHADPPEPSDYQSVIVAISPPTDAIEPRLIGDGSVIELVVTAGTDVAVSGYQEEPYLHFQPDGTVAENLRAPTTYLNRSLSGEPIPADASVTSQPQWTVVATDGSYAWHDHRTHWMGGSPPPDAERGDEVQAGVVHLVVNGTPVDISISTRWVDSPSAMPLLIGAVLGGVLLLVAAVLRRSLLWVLLAAATAAFVVGWWQYRSIPAEAEPPVVWWLLPAIAIVSTTLALVVRNRLASHALAILAALELAAWLYQRRGVATRATIPTDAPYWLDRAVIAATAVTAVVLVITQLAAGAGADLSSRGDRRLRLVRHHTAVRRRDIALSHAVTRWARSASAASTTSG